MALVIKDAVKKSLRARIALLAPTGGGKTYSGLKFLGAMVKLGMAKKIGVIDTEHGSASKYIGDFPPFRVIEMENDFSPEQYIEALTMLADDGCDGVLIDSLSHAWAGKGGSLELKDKFGRQKGFNDYTAWGPVSSMQNRMIEAMLGYPGHLVATMRLKMEHVLEEDPISKKKVVRKIGLQPQQRDGLEYEFDLVGDLDQEHNFSVSKTRCSALDGYAVNKPGEEVIRKMKAWLESGTALADRAIGKAPPAEVDVTPKNVVGVAQPGSARVAPEVAGSSPAPGPASPAGQMSEAKDPTAPMSAIIEKLPRAQDVDEEIEPPHDPVTGEVLEPAAADKPTPAEKLTVRVRAATTQEGLSRLGREIKLASEHRIISEPERLVLADVFAARRKEILLPARAS